MNEDHALLSSATVIDLKKQDVVFQEGDPADDSFYFVILGCLGVYRGKRGISTMYQGHFFGEIALILNEPRTATVLVQSETARLARFSRESFLEESRHNIHLTLRMLLTTLGRQLRILNEVRNAQQDGFRGLDTAGPILAELRQVNASIADSLTRMHVTYRPRDRAVFREGDRCDGNAFFILDGEITIYKRVNGVDIEAARLSAGGVAAQAGKAALAAATAASVSACAPSEITAQGSSVDGSITTQSCGTAGATQRPLM